MDFLFHNHGSIWTVEPRNKAARQHLVTHVQEDATWWGRDLVVEPRYVLDLAAHLADDGFDTNLPGSYSA